MPSPKLSTIPEVATPATTSSKGPLSSSPGQLTPIKRPAPPTFARVRYRFNSEESEELDVLRGDVVEILSMMSTDWWWARLRDDTGRIPTSHLELIDLKYQSNGSTIDKDSHNESLLLLGSESSVTSGGGHRQGSRDIPDRKRSVDKETLSKAEWVRARHVWNSDKSGELVLQAGDIIQVLKRPYEHWWKGRLARNGQVGLFPANFVEIAPPPPKRQSSTFDNNEAVAALRSNLAKLQTLLPHFDTTQDVAESAEIQVSRIWPCRYYY